MRAALYYAASACVISGLVGALAGWRTAARDGDGLLLGTGCGAFLVGIWALTILTVTQ